MFVGNLCVILNGPPGCGKDTLSDRLSDYGFRQHQFKYPLYLLTAEQYGVSHIELKKRATHRILKEEVWEETGKTPRKMLIDTSESIIKPKYGQSYFGDEAAARCSALKDDLVVFSDGGFKAEFAALLPVYTTVLVCRLHREGYSFAKDSRSYVYGVGVEADIELIEGKIKEAVGDIITLCEEFI